MQRLVLARVVAVAAALLCGSVQARAGFLPYPTPGSENPVTYTFTAAATGDVVAYFAGSGAAFENELGVSVNGAAPTIFGLNNKTSAVGASLILASVTAGDTLVFVMRNLVPGIGDVYSDPALNAPYDGTPTGHNHIYSTAFTGPDASYPGIPSGTYVAFEDLPATGTDWNYFDETFVFTNVATNVVPEPSTAVLLGVGVASLALARRRKAKNPII